MTIMRVIVAPLNASHRQEGQYQAFREVFGAHNVAEFDWLAEMRGGSSPGSRLYGLARDFAADWIWLQVQGEGVAPSWLWSIRRDMPQCLITHWMGDCRSTVSDGLRALCEATHGTLISNVGQLEMFREAGAQRVAYCQIGLDERWDAYGEYPEQPQIERAPDVVFIGNHYSHVADFKRGTAQRIATIAALMRAGVDVGVVGQGWPREIPVVGACHVKAQYHVYRRAKVALAINHYNEIDRYYSDRLLIAMASGTPTVAWYVPGLECEFTSYQDLIFSSVGEYGIVDHVKTLLADDRLRQKIGAAGRIKVLADHTWTARIHQIRPLIEHWRDQL